MDIEEKKAVEKRLKWLFLIIPFFAILFRYPLLDNDFYFIFTTGKLITEGGFPHTDMLSMHSNMKVVIQQWLSSVLFYHVYDLLGKVGVFTFTYIFYYLICILTYRTCRLVSDNPVVSAICAMFSDVLIFYWYIVSRPQVITYAILLTEIFFIELYVRSRKFRYLIALPILSVILVNCHASMWLMMFVFIMPYIAASLPLKIKAFEYKPCCNMWHLIIISVVSFAVGILNPYKTKGMFYLFSSYGQNKLKALIREMQATNFDTMNGKVLFISLALFAAVAIIYKKRAFTPRLVFLFLGTMLLAVMHNKSIPYFFIFGSISFSYLVKDVDIASVFDREFFRKNKSASISIMACMILVFALAGIKLFNESRETAISKNTHIKHLAEVTDILGKSTDEVVLYANFNDGQYFEFRGYHPYIDGRAELFLKGINEDFDYFDEYYDLINAGIYYRDFTDKYQFNYLVVGKETDRYLYSTLSKDGDFEQVYDSYDVVLFKRK